MTKNPILNALLGALYISGVVGLIQLATTFLHDSPDTFLIPIVMLSLFVLSAVVMTSIFFYQPLMLYLDGKKKESITLVFQTVAAFAVVTSVIFTALFLPVLL
jgi:uncharacterized membrane-anchored protein